MCQGSTATLQTTPKLKGVKQQHLFVTILWLGHLGRQLISALHVFAVVSGSAGRGRPCTQLTGRASVKAPVIAGLHGLSPSQMGLLIWQQCSKRASGSQGFEVIGCHCCHILLVKASHHAIPDSRQWGSKFYFVMGVVVKELWPHLTYEGRTASGRG